MRLQHARPAEPIALFLGSADLSSPSLSVLARSALLAGFRPFIVPWDHATTERGRVFVSGGMELMADRRQRHVSGWELMSPAIVVASESFGEYEQSVICKLMESSEEARLCLVSGINDRPKSRPYPSPDQEGHGAESLQQVPEAVGKADAASVLRIFGLWCFQTSDLTVSSIVRRSVLRFPDWEPIAAEEEHLLLERSKAVVKDCLRRHVTPPVGCNSSILSRIFCLIAIDLAFDATGTPAVTAAFDLSSVPLGNEGESACSAWMRYFFGLSMKPSVLSLPEPDFEFELPKVTVEASADGISRIRMDDLTAVLSDVASRSSFLRGVGLISDDSQILLQERGSLLQGLDFIAHRDNKSTVLDLAISDGTNFSKLDHPLSKLFPVFLEERGTVDTEPWPDSDFEYLDPALVGPDIAGVPHSEALLRYLGRSISSTPSADGLGKRFVEPGVGRTLLVDFVRVCGRPELHDFSITGAGLTPYSQAGFVQIGPLVNGRAALKRARHRQRCSELLEAAGCRVPKVVAIISLPGETIEMPDATTSPAVLIVRGFRSVMRVKQLDPVSSYYHSLQHSPQLVSYLMSEAWEPLRELAGDPLSGSMLRQSLMVAFDRYGPAGDDVSRIVSTLPFADILDAAARHRRRQIIYRYAPAVLSVVTSRLSQDPAWNCACDPPTEEQYVRWFARTLGRQLGIMRQQGFLHDYHHPGVSRFSPNWVYTLVENNVTLLAEFADLDTGFFVHDANPEMLDEIQLTSQDAKVLRDGFPKYHLADQRAAMRIVRTLSSIVFRNDTSRIGWAESEFTDAYSRLLSS